MKQFMILLVTLPLLLVFVMQFSLDQSNKAKAELIDSIVYAAKEQAKQDGCFTDANIISVKNQISSSLRIDQSRITIAADSRPVARKSVSGGSGLIHYKVSVDLGEAMAGAGLFNIGSSENRYIYTIDSYTVSEYLP